VRATARAIPILFFCLVAPSAAIEAGDGPPPSTGERLRELLQECNTGPGFRDARTDEERKAAVERLDGFPPRFLELMERSPRDPIVVDVSVELVRAINAVDSLIQTAWEMNTSSFPTRREDRSAGRAVALLLREQVRSEKLVPVCQRMSYGLRGEFETFLRTVLEKSPHRDVQAIACLSLAQFLKVRMQRLDLIKDRPELAQRYETLLGKEEFEEIVRQGRAGIAKEAERFLERAVADYADVKFPYGGTVGEKAKEELLEMRDLVAGMEAPDIEGKDQDGRQFKLSDYRGKVVLLDFWQEL
jgi:hypothetical protein